MLDVQNASAAPPATIRREDYSPPDWLVPEIELEFELGAERTRVRSTLQVERSETASDHVLRLDTEGRPPLQIHVAGEGEPKWRMDGNELSIELGTDSATIEIIGEIEPAANTQLMGLYASGGILCTQCEAEGFRRIIWC